MILAIDMQPISILHVLVNGCGQQKPMKTSLYKFPAKNTMIEISTEPEKQRR
jgi:hypothetical protein